MSVIEEFYNSTFSVSRKVAVSGTRIDSNSTVSSGNIGLIHPVTDKSKLYAENQLGREYRLYCDESIDIKNGDTITSSNKQYIVAGFNDFDDMFMSIDAHQRVVIVKQNTNG